MNVRLLVIALVWIRRRSSLRIQSGSLRFT